MVVLKDVISVRYFITFSYDGSKYSGYQKQPSVKTVQGEMEKVLRRIKLIFFN